MFVTFDFSNGDQPPKIKHNQDVPVSSGESSSISFSGLRKRSRMGCKNCKLRKRRCDEAKPACSSCVRLNKVCEYPQPQPKHKRPKTDQDIPRNPPSIDVNSRTSMSSGDHQTGQDSLSGVSPPSSTASPKTQLSFLLSPIQTASDPDEKALYNSALNIRSPSPFSEYLSAMMKGNSPLSAPENLFYARYDMPFLDRIEPLDEEPSAGHSGANAGPSGSADNSETTLAVSGDINLDLEDQFGQYMANQLSPLTSSPLSRLLPATLVNLDSDGMFLFQYYCEKVAFDISVVPVEKNQFLKTFLPLADQEVAVLYALISFGGMNCGGHYEERGREYFHKALKAVREDDRVAAKNNAVLSKKENYTRQLQKLATYLILVGSDIYRGDVKRWTRSFPQAARIVQEMGGIKNLQNDPISRFLANNFTYHDVLASSISERGPYTEYTDLKYVETGRGKRKRRRSRLGSTSSSSSLLSTSSSSSNNSSGSSQLVGWDNSVNTSKGKERLSSLARGMPDPKQIRQNRQNRPQGGAGGQNSRIVALDEDSPCSDAEEDRRGMPSGAADLEEAEADDSDADDEYEAEEGLDALLGLTKPLFILLSEVSKLAMRSKRTLGQMSHLKRDRFADDTYYDDDMAWECDYALGAEQLSHSGSGSESGARGGSSGEENGKSGEPGSDSLFNFKEVEALQTELEQVLQEARKLELQIDEATPSAKEMVALSAERNELEVQLTLFELMQITVKIHLLQSIYQMNPSTLQIQLLVSRLFKSLNILIHSQASSALCFPLFICGINCVQRVQKREILRLFKALSDNYAGRNIHRAKIIMKEVWLIDPLGSKYVDWYNIIKKFGWDLNFA